MAQVFIPISGSNIGSHLAQIFVDIHNVMLARRKMTLTELSRRLDIALPNLSILKNGHAKAIRMALLDALCRELDCQPGELLVWEPDDAAEKE